MEGKQAEFPLLMKPLFKVLGFAVAIGSCSAPSCPLGAAVELPKKKTGAAILILILLITIIIGGTIDRSDHSGVNRAFLVTTSGTNNCFRNYATIGCVSCPKRM